MNGVLAPMCYDVCNGIPQIIPHLHGLHPFVPFNHVAQDIQDNNAVMGGRRRGRKMRHDLIEAFRVHVFVIVVVYPIHAARGNQIIFMDSCEIIQNNVPYLRGEPHVC